MQNDVTIRGTRDGLAIELPDDLPFDRLLARLGEKLEASGRFFAGAEVVVRVGRRTLDAAQEIQLSELLALSQLALREIRVGGEKAPAASSPSDPPQDKPLVIHRTLRSGQLIRHRGDVIILGDVNPGAEVVADGHIVVLGTLRGVAHAGAAGDETSIVTASRLLPTQVRIARHVSRPPDDDTAATGPELARIHEGRMVIEGRTGH